jgi:hypothetical protein
MQKALKKQLIVSMNLERLLKEKKNKSTHLLFFFKKYFD